MNAAEVPGEHGCWSALVCVAPCRHARSWLTITMLRLFKLSRAR
jgi:hypothetical protein